MPLFILNSILLGIGLAMDAFSVSMANGLAEPEIKVRKTSLIALTFGGFQFAMPLISWLLIHTIATYFRSFTKLIPWIALVLLLFLGIKMIIEGVKAGKGEAQQAVSAQMLILQGIATSIDALSIGFTIAEYDWPMALLESFIIGAVTFTVCMAGVVIGKKIGTALSGKASVLGGIILICIGIEIFVKNKFF